MNITFMTGNANKAAYVAQAIGTLVEHKKIDLDEIQTLDSRALVEHKAKQAYAILQTPVLVEDVALRFHALGRLPGPLIKWFLTEIGNDGICNMLAAENDRAATASVCYGLYDGKQMTFFEGSMPGTIAPQPRGTHGFGWDQIFIREGQDQTRAELDEPTERATSMRLQPLQQLKEYITNAKTI